MHCLFLSRICSIFRISVVSFCWMTYAILSSGKSQFLFSFVSLESSETEKSIGNLQLQRVPPRCGFIVFAFWLWLCAGLYCSFIEVRLVKWLRSVTEAPKEKNYVKDYEEMKNLSLHLGLKTFETLMTWDQFSWLSHLVESSFPRLQLGNEKRTRQPSRNVPCRKPHPSSKPRS